MGISFYKSGEMKRSSYVKVPLRSSAILKIKVMISIVLFGQS